MSALFGTLLIGTFNQNSSSNSSVSQWQLVDQCTPTDCFGDDWVQGDPGVDAGATNAEGTVEDTAPLSGGCDHGNGLPKDCITVNTTNGTHLNYVIAQAAQSGSNLPGKYVVIKGTNCNPSCSWIVWLVSRPKTLPGDGLKYGTKWTNGGNGWNLANNTELCAGFVYYASDSQYHWMGQQVYDPANFPQAACKWVHT